MDHDVPRALQMPGLPSELLRAALDDAAPSDVRRGVLAVLGMDVNGGSSPARRGEVTTLSGVFEKGPCRSEQTSAATRSTRSEPMALSCAGHPGPPPGRGIKAAGALGPSHLQPTDLPARHFHPVSLLYLAAAAATGVLIAKAAHLGFSERTPSERTSSESTSSECASSACTSSGCGLAAAALSGGRGALSSSASLTCDPQRTSHVMMTRGNSLSADAITGEPGRAVDSSRTASGLRAATRPARFSAPPSQESMGHVVPQSAKARTFSASLPRVATRHGPVVDADPDVDVDFATEDWLGEQLEILARAERSLLDDDPDATLRSFEDYRERFPQGLLNPQMAAVRHRAEQRFGAFIFP